jgi:hypothetical protein
MVSNFNLVVWSDPLAIAKTSIFVYHFSAMFSVDEIITFVLANFCLLLVCNLIENCRPLIIIGPFYFLAFALYGNVLLDLVALVN